MMAEHDDHCESLRNLDCSCNCTWGVRHSMELMTGATVVLAKDTVGKAIDALNKAVTDINAASERMKAFGLSPQISVNGLDFGDKVSVYVQGDLVR